jgi:hypothetical protein
MFIIVNHEARTQVQIILLLQLATINVQDPTRYSGNTQSITGCGDVNVKMQDPAIVNRTDITSK